METDTAKSENKKLASLTELVRSTVDDQYRCADMVRSHLLSHNGDPSRRVFPQAKTLDEMDLVNRELKGLLDNGGTEDELASAIRKREKVSERLELEIKVALPECETRNFEPRALKEMLPSHSMRLFRVVGELGVANSYVLNRSLSQSKQTTHMQMQPLLDKEVVGRKPVPTIRNTRPWEFIYSLTPVGCSTFKEVFGFKPKYYAYNYASGKHVHHLATNIAACALEDFSPWGFYYGTKSSRISLEAITETGTRAIEPDSAGTWGTRTLYLEVELGGYMGFPEKVDKYLGSEAHNVMVVCVEEDMLGRYCRTVEVCIKNTKAKRSEAIWFHMLSLKSLLRDLPAEIYELEGERD